MINHRLIPTTLAALSALLCLPAPGRAQSILLTSGDFALLSGSGALANAGSPTIIDGNVGSSTTVTGFPPGLIFINNSPAVPIIGGTTLQAQLDLIKASNGLLGMPSNVTMSGVNLGGHTLPPGVYTFGAEAALDGALFLDANGQSNAVWVFQIGTSLTTSGTSDVTGASSVTLINAGPSGGNGAGIFWVAGAGITIGAGSTVLGNYLAGTSIAAEGAASATGGVRFLAQAGLTIAAPAGTAPPSQFNSTGGPGGSDWAGGLMYSPGGAVVPTPIPEPAAFLWLAPLGAIGLVLYRRRRREAATKVVV